MAILYEHKSIARAYSNDLRRKLLEAYDRGEGSLRELAERFGVSSPWAWKISAQRKRTGQVERVEQRHGPASKVTGAVEQRLRSWVRQQPDLTLVEIQERLWETAGLPVSVPRLWQVLRRRMQLRLKKVTPRPGTRHPGQSAAAGSGAGGAARDRSGATGVSGREWGHDGNDAPLRTSSVGRTRAGGDSGATREHAHTVGSPDQPGSAGQHDGGIADGRRRVAGLSGRGLVPLPRTGADRDRRQSRPIRWTACGSGSKRPGRRCSTCRLTPPTSIPLKRPGPRSSKTSARPKRA